MTIGPPQIGIAAVSEVVALLVIYRLWRSRRRRSIAFRMFWTALLLVPLLGPLLYFFITESPDEHPDDTDTMRGAADSYGDPGHY